MINHALYCLSLFPWVWFNLWNGYFYYALYLNFQMVMNRSCNFHLKMKMKCFSHLRTKEMIKQVRLRYYLKQKWSQKNLIFIVTFAVTFFWKFWNIHQVHTRAMQILVRIARQTQATSLWTFYYWFFPLMRFEIAWNTSAPSSVHKLPRVSILFCILRTILRLCEKFNIVVKT